MTDARRSSETLQPDAPPRREGFTLIELMVAITLMVILTGSITFIFIQAQTIFTTVDAKVQVYQYARYAFDQMERDLANVIETRDMEFYNDRGQLGGQPGRFDGVSEEIPIMGTANRDAFPNNQALGDRIFNYGFTIRQPVNYKDRQQREWRWDSVYFKTVTVVDGQTQAALIEYAMVDTDRVRPKLQKRLWRVTGVDNANPLAPRYDINGGTKMPDTQDLCLYTVDCRFEIFVLNRRRSFAGDFFSAKQMIDPPKIQRGAATVPVFEKTKNWWNTGSDAMSQCYYDGDWDEGAFQSDVGEFIASEGGLVNLFRTQKEFTFPMLKEGDRIYLWGGGSAFKAKAYTIKQFLRVSSGAQAKPWDTTAPASEFRIQFVEPIQGMTGSRMQVQFAGVYSPSALRVTLRIKDSKSLEDRSVARVFKILAQ